LKTLLLIMITMTGLGTANLTVAGDIAAGQSKAALCGACHGPNGFSMNDLWPNLAGQKEAYIIKQIKAFRDGQREDPTMLPMVKPLTDTDIENLAAYFNSLK